MGEIEKLEEREAQAEQKFKAIRDEVIARDGHRYEYKYSDTDFIERNIKELKDQNEKQQQENLSQRVVVGEIR